MWWVHDAAIMAKMAIRPTIANVFFMVNYLILCVFTCFKVSLVIGFSICKDTNNFSYSDKNLYLFYQQTAVCLFGADGGVGSRT